jgi:hypothetical protein
LVRPLAASWLVGTNAAKQAVQRYWWRIVSLRVPAQLKKGFDSLVVLGAWVIWKHRNSCVFNGVAPIVPAVLGMDKEEDMLSAMARAKGISMIQAVGTAVV